MEIKRSLERLNSIFQLDGYLQTAVEYFFYGAIAGALLFVNDLGVHEQIRHVKAEYNQTVERLEKVKYYLPEFRAIVSNELSAKADSLSCEENRLEERLTFFFQAE